MKEIIYMNNNIIESYLAQKNKGLEHDRFSGIKNAEKDMMSVKNGGDTNTTSMSAGPTFLNLKSEFTISDNINCKMSEVSETAYEVARKISHDNILNDFLDVENNSIMTNTDFFKIIDLGFLSDFLENDYIPLQLVLDKMSIEESLNSDNTLTKKQIKNLKKEMGAEKNAEIEETKATIQFIKFICKTLPSDVFILHENTLFPLESKYLRYESNKIKFYFNDKTTICYRKSGCLADYAKISDLNIFSEMFTAINNVNIECFNLLGLSEETQIGLPIAWYQETSLDS